jgi:hypothetical protein
VRRRDALIPIIIAVAVSVLLLSINMEKRVGEEIDFAASLREIRVEDLYMVVRLSANRPVKVVETVCRMVTGAKEHGAVSTLFNPPREGVSIDVPCPPDAYGEVVEIAVKGSVNKKIMLAIPRVGVHG